MTLSSYDKPLTFRIREFWDMHGVTQQITHNSREGSHEFTGDLQLVRNQCLGLWADKDRSDLVKSSCANITDCGRVAALYKEGRG